MPLRLLDLPEEILLRCLKYVANSGREDDEDSGGDIETISFATSATLCISRLVCKDLARIASPWFWRELDVKLPFQKRRGQFSGAYHRLNHFVAHPEYIKFLKMLSIQYFIHPRRDEDAFTLLSTLLDAAQNLNFLMVNGGGGQWEYHQEYDHLAWDFKLKGAIRHNLNLHTVISDGCPLWLHMPYSSFKLDNVRHLRAGLSHEVLGFVGLCGELKSLALSRGFLTDMEVEELRKGDRWSVPWESLEELQLEWLSCSDIIAIADIYSVGLPLFFCLHPINPIF